MRLAVPAVGESAPSWHHLYLAPGSVIATLLLMNALFGLQNVLDMIFMWSGEPLPDGMTYAAYAHRGAYPLIVTALLAGALVIVALWPGSITARHRIVRLLVYLWLVQNVLLVASTIERTLAYVDVYGMTELRLAALIWMALVGWGLFLIAWRIAFERSNQWLVNANFVSAATLLLISSFLDHKAIVADWNVEAAITRPERLAAFDHAYLRQLGVSALPATRRLEQAIAARPPGAIDFQRQFLLPKIRNEILELEALLQAGQSDFRRWNLRHSFIAEPMALIPVSR
jgi:hypothetical protein